MSGYQAQDGTFTEVTGHTTTSFEDFLAAMGQEVPEVKTEEALEVEASEEQETEEMDFEDLFGEEKVEEEDEESTEDGVEEDSEDDSEESSEEASEEEVDFGELEIDLDSEIQVGEDFISVNDLIKNRIAADEIKTQREELETRVQEVEAKDSRVVETLERAKLECDKVIEDYKEFDWKKMAAEDPKAYTEHREFLEAYLARKEEIDEDFAKAKEVIETKEAEAKSLKAQETVRSLKADIPTWNDDLYQKTMTYAIDVLGMDQEFVVNTMDAGFFKTVVNVMKRESDLKTAVTKVRSKVVKKVAKSNAPKAAVKKAPKKGIGAGEVGISSRDAAAFEEFSKLDLF